MANKRIAANGGISEMNQVVDYRFGEKYSVTSFIQPDVYEVQNVASMLKRFPSYPYPELSKDKLVELASAFIRKDFVYPLDNSGKPAVDGSLIRYRKSWFTHLVDEYRYYVWAFPSEVLKSGYGYCAETANLMTSILRALGIEAYTALGEVRKTDDSLLGYHAWTVTKYLNQEYLDETTIHKDANALITTLVAYDRVGAFAQTGDIYYVEHGRYNELGYTGTTQLGKSEIIFSLMGKPQKLLNVYGLEKLEQINPKKLYKAWREEEVLKHKMVWGAYS
jgi:hypothetical protein